MRRILLTGLAALGLVVLLVWAFRPQPEPVETALVAPRDIAVVIEAEGVARIRDVFTVSAPIAGRLHRVELHPGDEVTAGEPVAQIGPAAAALLDSRSRAVAEASVSAALAAVDLAQAQVAQAEAELDHALAEAERTSALFDRATVSQRLLDSAILARRTAEAALASAKASLAVRERELESARAVLAGGDAAGDASCCVGIVTPVSGRILRVVTEDEQVVPAGAPILEIGNLGNMEISADLLSRDAVRVVPGAEARITGWGGPPLSARVERVRPAAVTEVSALGIEEQRVEVILDLTGDARDWLALGHGFRVIAEIEVWSGQDVLSVPIGALFRDGPDWASFVIRDGRALLRRIVIGERNETDAQVLEGLEAGDIVVLHPGDGIDDGTRVSPDRP